MRTKIYSGYISIAEYQDEVEVLRLSGHNKPLAYMLQNDISKKTVSVSYYILDKETTLENAQISFLKQLDGDIAVEYQPRYSEITGYLYTDETIKIGGHNLLKELQDNDGKYLILICKIH